MIYFLRCLMFELLVRSPFLCCMILYVALCCTMFRYVALSCFAFSAISLQVVFFLTFIDSTRHVRN